MNVGMLEIETLHHERSGTSIQATSPFAIRIRKFRETVKALHEKGYREDGANGDLLTKVQPRGNGRVSADLPPRSGSTVIEVNAERLERQEHSKRKM